MTWKDILRKTYTDADYHEDQAYLYRDKTEDTQYHVKVFSYWTPESGEYALDEKVINDAESEDEAIVWAEKTWKKIDEQLKNPWGSDEIMITWTKWADGFTAAKDHLAGALLDEEEWEKEAAAGVIETEDYPLIKTRLQELIQEGTYYILYNLDGDTVKTNHVKR